MDQEALSVARSLAGIPPVPTQAQLVNRFVFDGSVYGNGCSAPKHFKSYTKPTRGALLEQISSEIMKADANGFPGKKRPKHLAGAVLKRVYGSYPETKAFHKMWEKLDDQENEAHLARLDAKYAGTFAPRAGLGGKFRGHREKNRLR